MNPSFGSLFSGIGGLDLGLERAGWTCRWQVENDPYCVKVLEKHWPNVKRYGDVRLLDPKELEAVDLVCGGFPCQSVSVAGKRKAQKDERWLWPEFARIIRVVRPRFILVENVPGILYPLREKGTHQVIGPPPVEEVLGDLAESGYDAEWDCLRASDIGAPHKRERVFIVAYSSESGFRTPIAHVFPRQPHLEGSINPDSHKNGCDNQQSHNQAQTGEGDARTQAERISHRNSMSSNIDGDGREGTNLHLRPRKQAQTTTKLYGRSQTAHNDRERIQRIFQGEISRVKEFSWCENVRRVEDLQGRPNIPEPLFRRSRDGVPDWMDRIASLGNAVVPQVAEWIGNILIAQALAKLHAEKHGHRVHGELGIDFGYDYRESKEA